MEDLMKSKRCEWLDSLRCVAIILVIIGHVIGGLENEGGKTSSLIRDVIYSFHMPLMFVISGLVAKNFSMVNHGSSCINFFFEFMKKNIIALYIPYLIWGYAFWTVKYFIYAGNRNVTLEDGINLFWNYYDWPVWYLLILLFIKIIDILIQIMGIKLEYQGLIWLSAFIIGAFFNVYLLSNICCYGIFFYIGRYLQDRKKTLGRLFIIYLFVLVAGIILYINHYDYFGKLFTGSSISVLFVILFSKFNLTSPVMALIGENSMVPYVLHAYFTIPIRIFLNKINCGNVFIYIIAESSAAVILSLIIIILMKRIKFLGMLEVLFYPTRKQHNNK